jgi:hypothetical protein
MKLFTIGDSISQGFMSGAAARTDLSYSTLLSKLLGAKDYCYPTWSKEGLPVNIETVFRRLEKRLGPDIAGILEWPVALNIINNYLDEVEDYYERGEGWPSTFKGNCFHNVSVRGFDVAYSWLIKPDLCRKVIRESKGGKDNWWGLVDNALLRTALRVLESGAEGKVTNPSQLDWLKYHHQTEGVENLVLWLGANNALGTVLDLKIIQTSIDGSAFAGGAESVDYAKRARERWNLWHPEDFRVEYQYMIDKVVQIMQDNKHGIDYKIFVATVPLVTIVPLTKSVGGPQDREMIKVIEWFVDEKNPSPMDVKELSKESLNEYSYGKYYPYFPFADNFEITQPHLNLSQVLHIDNTIRKYNRIIQEIVANANKKIKSKRFYLVDISAALSKMALKRNSYNPDYEYPDFFKYAYPKVDTRYYGTTRKGEIMSGGIFSLDGVHPTAIGQGLIAYEFLKVMKKAGSYSGNPENSIDWNNIFRSDTLYSQPLKITSEIYDNISLKKWLFEIINK